MQDRTPTPGQEGRVLITPEDGSTPFYAKVEMADNPTQNGTAYSKHDVLQDVTCDSIGIPHESTPNDAFLALSFGNGKYGYIITVLLPNGSPAVGASITGGTTPSGDTPITDDSGVAIVVSSSQSISVSVESPYIDILSSNQTQISSSGILTSHIITLQTSGERTFSTSYTGKTSSCLLSFDLCGVAAGGGGGAGENESAPDSFGPGGGGGEVKNSMGITAIAEQQISFAVGAGGARGEKASSAETGSGKDGGNTTVTYGGTSVLNAVGGKGGPWQSNSGPQQSGGIGNGNGGDGGYGNTPGGAGQNAQNTYKFQDESLGIPGGGGGAGGDNSNAGSPNGAKGAVYPNDATAAGIGGGGGGGYQSSWSLDASAGGDGIIYFRPHYKQGVA